MSQAEGENWENPVDEITNEIDGINLNQNHGITLTEPSLNSLRQLLSLQEEHKSIEDKFEQEWLALKAHYDSLYRPLYKTRAEILTNLFTEDGLYTTSIPKFWLTVLWNSYTLRSMIEEDDAPILEYLIDIKSEWLDDKKQESFILHFVFAPNPYFTNTILTKQYNLEREPNDDDPMFSSTKSTKIDWKENKDVTKKYSLKKKKNKKTSEIKVVKEPVEYKNSFFSFFSNIEIPTSEKLKSMRRDQIENLRHDLEFEYGAGVTLRDRIIPYAVKWYLGQMESDDENWSISETFSEIDQDDASSVYSYYE